MKSQDDSSTDALTIATDTAADSAPAPVANGADVVAPHPSAVLVDTWFAKHFHNMSALFDERATVHLLGAKEDLKSTLAQSL